MEGYWVMHGGIWATVLFGFVKLWKMIKTKFAEVLKEVHEVQLKFNGHELIYKDDTKEGKKK